MRFKSQGGNRLLVARRLFRVALGCALVSNSAEELSERVCTAIQEEFGGDTIWLGTPMLYREAMKIGAESGKAASPLANEVHMVFKEESDRLGLNCI